MAEEQKTPEQKPGQVKPKFPSEVVDLPSGGKLYPESSPLRSGKIELKYMTAREEDILTSQNLIKKGVVIDKLLNSLILTPGVTTDDLFLGDKNAVMVAARILAYGSEYTCEVTNPNTGETQVCTFNLADCPFRKLPEDMNLEKNAFDIVLPVSKTTLTFKLLTGREERLIDEEIKAAKKIGMGVSPELTTRLRHTIIGVDGEQEQMKVNQFVDNMLSRDSLHFRRELSKLSPDIELKQTVHIGDEPVEVDIPMTVDFFWPKAV